MIVHDYILKHQCLKCFYLSKPIRCRRGVQVLEGYGGPAALRPSRPSRLGWPRTGQGAPKWRGRWHRWWEKGLQISEGCRFLMFFFYGNDSDETWWNMIWNMMKPRTIINHDDLGCWMGKPPFFKRLWDEREGTYPCGVQEKFTPTRSKKEITNLHMDDFFSPALWEEVAQQFRQVGITTIAKLGSAFRFKRLVVWNHAQDSRKHFIKGHQFQWSFITIVGVTAWFINTVYAPTEDHWPMFSFSRWCSNKVAIYGWFIENTGTCWFHGIWLGRSWGYVCV